MFAIRYLASKLLSHIDTNVRINVLYKRLSAKNYSEGRILKNIIRYRINRQMQWSMANVAHTVSKAIRKGNPIAVMSDSGVFKSTHPELVGKTLSALYPSISFCVVMHTRDSKVKIYLRPK